VDIKKYQISREMGPVKSWTILWVLCVTFFTSCGNSDEKDRTRYDRGTIHISVDESFRPVMEDMVQLYEANYQNVRIIPHFKSEADCLKDFTNDSIQMVFATRDFTEGERLLIIDSIKIAPEMGVLAYDAIAVIVHSNARDSVFSMENLQNIILGKDTSWTPVFDGLNATSTVRFILDSILKQDVLGKNVKAAENSIGVIDYVSKDPNAVGFVGVSWIGNLEDSGQVAALQKVKMAFLQSVDNPDEYIKPSQAGIYNFRYPMVRNLVYVVKENYTGLAHGFAFFLKNERGQLAFRRAYLKPATRPYRQRKAAIKLK